MMHNSWTWGMGWAHAIGVLIVILVIVALIKYIFFD
jgi:hypothetical protein